MNWPDLFKDAGPGGPLRSAAAGNLQGFLQALPCEVVILGRDLRVIAANLERPASPDGLSAPGKHLLDVMYSDDIPKQTLAAMVENCLQSRQPVHLQGKRFKLFPTWAVHTMDVHMAALPGTQGTVAVSFANTDLAAEMQFQLDLLYELGSFMVGTVDLNRLLFLMLTGITAGPALGFNRALIFLLDDRKERLVGSLGVGPASAEEAGLVWSRVSQQKKFLRDFLLEYDEKEKKALQPMTALARELSCAMKDERHVLVRTVLEKKVCHKRRPTLDESVSPAFFRAYQHVEFITIPLLADGEALGVIVADNRFNWRPIEDRQKNILSIFANLAGISVQNVYRHRKLLENLEKTREASMQLEQSTKKLRTIEQYATVGRMAAFVAHEIRNPLSTIGGFARATLKNIDNLDKVKRNAQIIVREAQRLEDLLTEILDYMRDQVPRVEKNSLAQVVVEVCEMAQVVAEKNGVTVAFRRNNAVPDFRFDRKLIKQAVLNILKNALSFSPTGSTVTIDTELAGREVVLRVHDQGPGIEPETAKQMFNPFFSTQDSGTGLGLTITRRIVEGHHGSISFESEKGKGTTFFIRLPVS